MHGNDIPIVDMAGERVAFESNCMLGKILSDLFFAISNDMRHIEGNNYLDALLSIYYGFAYCKTLPSKVCRFLLDDKTTGEVIGKLKAHLQSVIPRGIGGLNSPITYLFDELICNIQQHAETDMGYVFADYNQASDSIEIVIADEGITI